MSVRAIFYVESMVIEPHDRQDPESKGRQGKVKLRAAAKGPYQKWSKWTPYGELELGTLNPAAFAWFEERLGTDIALTFDDPTEADLAAE